MYFSKSIQVTRPTLRAAVTRRDVSQCEDVVFAPARENSRSHVRTALRKLQQLGVSSSVTNLRAGAAQTTFNRLPRSRRTRTSAEVEHV